MYCEQHFTTISSLPPQGRWCNVAGCCRSRTSQRRDSKTRSKRDPSLLMDLSMQAFAMEFEVGHDISSISLAAAPVVTVWDGPLEDRTSRNCNGRTSPGQAAEVNVRTMPSNLLEITADVDRHPYSFGFPDSENSWLRHARDHSSSVRAFQAEHRGGMLQSAAALLPSWPSRVMGGVGRQLSSADSGISPCAGATEPSLSIHNQVAKRSMSSSHLHGMHRTQTM